MALTDENGSGMVMPVAPMYGNGGSGGGFMNGDGWWVLILFILLGGWNNGFGGGFGGGNDLYPWMNNSQNINNGFRDQMLNDNITSIRDGVYGIGTQLCNGFAGVNANIANGFAQAEIAENSRQMANMQQLFGVQSALQNCCCENRAGLSDVKYTIATENCADRAALSDGIRDLLAAQTAGFQSIKDQLCADKIDAKNDTIAQLRQELLFARGQASHSGTALLPGPVHARIWHDSCVHLRQQQRLWLQLRSVRSDTNGRICRKCPATCGTESEYYS